MMGVANALLQNAAQAEACFHKVLSLNNDHIPANRLLGRLLAVRGRTDGAMDLFRRILMLDPGNSQAASDIASLQKRAGRIQHQAGMRM